MFEIERYLPEEHQFNASVSVMRDIVEEQFNSTFERTGEVLDVDIEFMRSPESTWEMSRVLAECLKTDDDESTEHVQGAIYRGINFGLQLSDAIMDGPLRGISLGFWVEKNEHLTPQELGDAISADVHVYLSERPDIDAFIGQYMPELGGAEYGLYEHYIEIAAGMMIVLCERQQAEAYFFSEVVGGVSPEEV